MSNPSLLKVLRRAGDDDERRRHGRLRIDPLKCDAGMVLDLSGAGARLICRRPWRVGCMRTIVISDGHYGCQLNACSVRCTRVGFFKHDIGILFEQVTAEQARQLMALAMAHSRPETFVTRRSA